VRAHQRLQATQRRGVALIGVAAGGDRAGQALLVSAARVALARCPGITVYGRLLGDELVGILILLVPLAPRP